MHKLTIGNRTDDAMWFAKDRRTRRHIRHQQSRFHGLEIAFSESDRTVAVASATTAQPVSSPSG